jgi:hypothetical protein
MACLSRKPDFRGITPTHRGAYPVGQRMGKELFVRADEEQ